MLATSNRSNPLKFPRIDSKPRSLPGDKVPGIGPQDITAKAWMYSTAQSQYGTISLTQESRQA